MAASPYRSPIQTAQSSRYQPGRAQPDSAGGAGSGSGDCGCNGRPAIDPNLNACNVLWGEPVNYVADIASSACDATKCMAGVGFGLRKVPFEVTVTPGTPVTVPIEFTRDSYIWGVAFYQGNPGFDRQLFTISELVSSQQTQAWERFGQDSLFAANGAQPYDANTDPIPLELFFEAGTDSLSMLGSGRNMLPPLITNTNVGRGNSQISFVLTIDPAAPAAQTATGWLYAFFPVTQKKAG